MQRQNEPKNLLKSAEFRYSVVSERRPIQRIRRGGSEAGRCGAQVPERRGGKFPGGREALGCPIAGKATLRPSKRNTGLN